MADSDISVAKTILYLRPQGTAADEVLDIAANERYVVYLEPPPAEPVDLPVEGGIPDPLPATHLTYPSNRGGSRQSTPGLYPISRRVLRLAFDSIEQPSARGFEFGNQPNSDVKVPYYSSSGNRNGAYFRLHYNLNSGALLITALSKIMVGSAHLNEQRSLLLMADTIIRCGGEFEFEVEFPDVSSCAEEYERNYRAYATRVGFPDAPYMESSRENLLPIGKEYRSKTILGQGVFGEVHKALNSKDGKAYAIKILNRGMDAIQEIKLMENLDHENIIRYEHAFSLPSGKVCIVMELAVNDLNTFREARRSNTRRSYLSLECIRSIGRQALSGLDYLHDVRCVHRDLKPQNILVTKWDTKTDIATIKLADFGMARIGSEYRTFCGTPAYHAPEIGVEHRPGMTFRPYTSAVDIWAMGKILQELLQDVPSSHVRRGKSFPVNKYPAHRLINRMMEHDPKRRPTAAECLSDPWLVTTNTADSQLAQKRGRSPAPSSSSPISSTEQPLRKVMRRAIPESSKPMVINAIWPHKSSYHGGSLQAARGVSPANVDTKSHYLAEEGQNQNDHPQASQLNIQSSGDQLSFTVNTCDNVMGPRAATGDKSFPVAISAGHAGTRRASPAMQDIVRRLLAAFQEEGFGENVVAAYKRTDVGEVRDKLSRLSISSLQVRQESQSSIMLGLEFDNQEWTSIFLNEGRSPINHNAGSQLVGSGERNDAAAAANNNNNNNNSRSHSYLKVMFSQGPQHAFLDQPSYHQPENGPAPRSLVYDSSSHNRGNMDNISDLDQSGLGSDATGASSVRKGVTYPRNLDDPMADLSFGTPGLDDLVH